MNLPPFINHYVLKSSLYKKTVPVADTVFNYYLRNINATTKYMMAQTTRIGGIKVNIAAIIIAGISPFSSSTSFNLSSSTSSNLCFNSFALRNPTIFSLLLSDKLQSVLVQLPPIQELLEHIFQLRIYNECGIYILLVGLQEKEYLLQESEVLYC